MQFDSYDLTKLAEALMALDALRAVNAKGTFTVRLYDEKDVKVKYDLDNQRHVVVL